jgi:hypothetical protein
LEERRRGPGYTSFQALSDLQIGLGVRAVYPLVIRKDAVVTQHYLEPTIPKATPLCRELLKPL